MLWPLRPLDSAQIDLDMLSDGRRRIEIQHRELVGVTPEMLAWWFANIDGDMTYAGEIVPRYLVWHPLDHIAYEVERPAPGGRVAEGARLHIREAFQRDPDNLLDLHVGVERLDTGAAIIGRRAWGVRVLRLVNRFERTPRGARTTSVMTIGGASRLHAAVLNRILCAKILPGEKAWAWVRHHVEEMGNLEHFLPALYAEHAPPRRTAAAREAPPRGVT